MKIAYKIRKECFLLARKKAVSFSRPSTFYPRPSKFYPRQKPTLHWLKTDGKVITTAEREGKDSRSSGMFESCILRSRSCFGTRVLRFILSGERNSYEEEITITFGRNEEEIIISGLSRV